MRSFHRVKPGDESLVVRSLPEPIINKPISQLFSVDSRRYIGARFCRLERFTHGQNLWFEAKVPRILQQILREKAARDSMFQHPPPPLEGGLEFFPPPRENFLPTQKGLFVGQYEGTFTQYRLFSGFLLQIVGDEPLLNIRFIGISQVANRQKNREKEKGFLGPA